MQDDNTLEELNKKVELLKEELKYYKNIEQELIDNQDCFKAIFDNNAAAITILGIDKKVQMVNDAYCRVTGFSKNDIIGRDWKEFIPETQIEQSREAFETRFPNICTKPYNFEFIFYNKNREIRNGIASMSFLKNHNKIISSFIDITDIKDKERQIERISNELFQLNLDKDKFISILAHDLKSPFSSILGFLELLKKNINSYDINTIKRHLDYINDSALNTFNLLEELLLWINSHSGKINFEPQNIALNDLCNDVLIEFKLIASTKDILITQDIPFNTTVLADSDMLKVIIRNLVSNAIKYTNNKGKILVTAFRNDDLIIISVIDDGAGIPADIALQIFDFKYTHSTKGTANEMGTGLGLTLCKEFVERNKGKIWIESEEGKGSNFSFSIPIGYK
jgi:two-component system, sensor histidine kinase and response regulator